MKSFMISIDGPDRAGKSSVIKAILKKSKGLHIMLDRAILSNIVYNNIYDRKHSEKDYWSLFEKFTSAGLITVFLTANLDTLKQRYINTNEKDLDIKAYPKHLKVWNSIYNIAKKIGKNNVMKINTSDMSIDLAAKTIISNLRKL